MTRLYKALLISLITGALGVFASLTPLGVGLEEHLGLNVLFSLRGDRAPPSDVVIVSLDKTSMDLLNLPDEPNLWPRNLHAYLTEKLAKRGAAVIAFDMLFSKPGPGEHDKLFARAMARAGNVVLCEHIKKQILPISGREDDPAGQLIVERLSRPLSLFKASALELAPFPLPKVPVQLSQYWTFKTGAGDAPTLPVVVFKIYALGIYEEFVRLLDTVSPSRIDQWLYDKDGILRNKQVKKTILTLRGVFSETPFIGEKMIRAINNLDPLLFDAGKKQLLKSLVKIYQGPKCNYLNFYGPPGTIKTVPYHQLVLPVTPFSRGDAIDFKGKAVFVGLSETLRFHQKDGFYSVFPDRTGWTSAALKLLQVLLPIYWKTTPFGPWFFPGIMLSFLFGACVWGVCVYLSPGLSALGVTGLSGLYIGGALFGFSHSGTWSPIVIPLFFQAPLSYFGTTLWKFCETNKERRNIKKAFSYYLPEKVVSRLARNSEDFNKDIQVLYGTCLFTDAEKYTSLSEKMDPKALRHFMNDYYRAVFEPVKRYDGFISDIRGDAMLSIWTSAGPDIKIKKNACFAALEISSIVNQFKNDALVLKLPTRIGLHSGYITLGNIGAMDHYEYRPVGDIVNTASRIENMNKLFGTRIALSGEVLHQVDGFLTRKLGKFIFAGKSEPVTVYELICRIEECTEKQRDLCGIFADGLNAFYNRSWECAAKAFKESLRMVRQDGPSAFYLDLCKMYKINSPRTMWDGSIKLRKN